MHGISDLQHLCAFDDHEFTVGSTSLAAPVPD